MSEYEFRNVNARALDDSSEIKISISNHSINNSSLSELVASDGSFNILSNSYQNLINPQINFELKQKWISDFSQLNIYDNKKNDNFDFSLNNVEQEILSDKLYKKRKIKKDENNFNRSIIFCYLENLVLIKDNYTMKEFIIKFNEMDSESDYKIYIDINKEKIIHILQIILSYLEENKIEEAYVILLKAFIFYPEFDFCLNFFVRRLI